jgi:hypothetical protein
MNSWWWFFGSLFFMVVGIMMLVDNDIALSLLWMAASVFYGAIWAQEL